MIDIHKSQMISNNNTYISICNILIGKQITGPNQSILKHGPKGCCQHYLKQHHKMVSDQHLVTCTVILSSQIFLPMITLFCNFCVYDIIYIHRPICWPLFVLPLCRSNSNECSCSVGIGRLT